MSNFYSSTQAMFRLSDKASAYVTQHAAAGKSRELPVTIALAMAACQLVSLPGGDVDSPEEYFLSNAGVIAAEAIESVNEIMPVNFKQALELTKNLYLVRYELAQKPFKAFGYTYEEGLASLFGLNNHLPEDVLHCMRTFARDIIYNFNQLNIVIESIRKE